MFIDHTVRLLLDSLGRSEEYEFYIQKFKSDVSECFALLCPDQDVLNNHFEVLNVNLNYLQKLEIMPALLIFTVDAGKIVNKLKKNQNSNLFFSDDLSPGESVVEILKQSHDSGKIPVLWSSQVILFYAIHNYIRCVSSRVHFMRMDGAIRDPKSNQLNYIKNTRDAATLHESDRAVFELSKTLLSEFPRMHISICSPYKLLEEVFTVTGAGTIIRPGSCIYSVNLQNLEMIRLKQLLTSSFTKRLNPDFDFSKVVNIIYEKNYLGAILLEEHSAGMYMSKFAVGSQAQGVGIGLELWENLLSRYPRIFWRSRNRNSINNWYHKQADGFHKLNAGQTDSWVVFWKGLATNRISEIIEYCNGRPDDFIQND